MMDTDAGTEVGPGGGVGVRVVAGKIRKKKELILI